MLVFVVPLRNPATCRDWRYISALCERSLRSMCQQRAGAFHVYLVCREPPAMNFTHPALSIIAEDFPDPAPHHDALEADKWVKLKRGLIAARVHVPAHIMLADADDLVHRNLAALPLRDPHGPGWHVSAGYLYQEPARRLYRWPEFDLFCGTSALIRCAAEELPEAMTDDSERFPILTKGHPIIRAYMAGRGTPLRAVPFPGAIYVTGTGENHSGINLNAWRGRKITLQKFLRRRPVTSDIREAFGLAELPS